MTITVYADVIAPNSIWSAGVRGKLMRVNRRSRVASGKMLVNVLQAVTLRQYEFGTVPLDISQWQALEALYEVTDAGAFGFLVQDPKDCSASITTGKATLISAPAHTYQLIKRYTSVGSSRTKDRTIRRPRATGFILYISGVPELSYTLNADTGVITIPSDPLAANIAWASVYYVPVHFENDEIDWDLVRAGDASTRLAAGPQIVLTEVAE